MTRYFLGFLLILSLILTTGGATVSAHNGEDHGTTASTTHESEELHEYDRVRLENMLTLLQQLLKVMTELQNMRSGQGGAPAVSTSVPAAVDDAEEEMDEHHDEHGEDSTEPVAKLVIEIEPHNGKTHVHVRYTDKPEEMFFVDPAIGNEDEIVSAIASRTGLSADVIRPALKYNQ